MHAASCLQLACTAARKATCLRLASLAGIAADATSDPPIHVPVVLPSGHPHVGTRPGCVPEAWGTGNALTLHAGARVLSTGGVLFP